jgi:hypothetical protein
MGSLLATGNIGWLSLDEEGALYWVEGMSSTNNGAVHRMQSRVDSVIASGQHQAGGLAVDSTHAYFTCASWDGTDRAIRRVPRKGGSVETLVTPSGYPISVRVDFSNVYYQDNSPGLWAVSKATGVQRKLSSLNGSGWLPSEFDVNASVAWWLWVGSGINNGNGLFSVNADGTSFTAVDTSGDYFWSGPRVDDTAVYYVHNGALLRRLK